VILFLALGSVIRKKDMIFLPRSGEKSANIELHNNCQVSLRKGEDKVGRGKRAVGNVQLTDPTPQEKKRKKKKEPRREKILMRGKTVLLCSAEEI